MGVAYSAVTPATDYVFTTGPVTFGVTWTYTGPPAVPDAGITTSILWHRVNGGAWRPDIVSMSRSASYVHRATISPGAAAFVEWYCTVAWWDGTTSQSGTAYSAGSPNRFTTAVASCTSSAESPADGASVGTSPVATGCTWTFAGFPGVPAGGIVGTSVAYRKNGGSWQFTSQVHSPYVASYSPSASVSVAMGDRVDWYSFATYSDGATQVTEYSGTASSPYNYTVPTDSTGPTISGRSPADASSAAPAYTAGVRFQATASDTWGIATVKLYVDGSLEETVTSGSLTAYVPLNKGAHTWYVVAEDNNGNTTTSPTWTHTVTNAVPLAPTALLLGGVAIASATTRTSAIARLSWTAGNDLNPEDSVTYKIEASYNGGGYSTLVASQAAVTYDWTPTTAGTATIRITPNDGTADGATVSGTCTVGTGTAPNDPVLTDIGGGTYTEGSTIAVVWTPASPVDPDGDPVTYELEFSALGTFADVVLIASGLTASPYSWSLAASLVAADTATCKVRLRARDNYEMVSAYSTSTAFTVTENVAPTPTIVSPAAAAVTTDRLVPLIVQVADADAGDTLHVRIELSESADYSIGVVAPDTSVSQLGWESSPSPYTVWSAFPAGGCNPGDRARFTPTTNLRYDLYYYRAQVEDNGGFVSAWVESTFRVAPAPGSPVVVTVGSTDYSVSSLVVTETSGGEPSSLAFTVPSDVYTTSPMADAAAVSCAVNIEGTARTWSGTLSKVQLAGAYAQCVALLDDAYLSRKLATGNVVSKDLGQALKDLVTSYGSPLTGAGIDVTTGVSMALTGAHKQLREHFAEALGTLDSYMLWVDSTGDVHFADVADLAVPSYLLKES